MDKQEAITKLHELLKPGDTVYCILRHVSRSGMSRSISCVLIKDGEPWEIDYLVAPATERQFDQKHGGVKEHGCGMDMGFHLVYSLSYAMFPDGFDCIGEGCPANDHVNRDYVEHATFPDHRDGGYALNHRWL